MSFSGSKKTTKSLAALHVSGVKLPAYLSKRYWHDNKPLFLYNVYGTPVLTFAFETAEYLGNLNLIPFDSYSEGFLIGYNSNFIPYIDTPEARLQLLRKEIEAPLNGFPFDLISKEYSDKLVLEYGRKIGRLYKAWEIVFENPAIFSDDLKQVKEQALKTGKVQPKVLSYTWSEINGSIEKLREQLLRNGLIAEIDSETFSSIFNGLGKKTMSAIKWRKSNKLLVYLLRQLFSEVNWQAIAGSGDLFKNERNKTLKQTDLSSAMSEVNRFGQPIGHETIDLILSNIKKP
jgi:hypothetical protein